MYIEAGIEEATDRHFVLGVSEARLYGYLLNGMYLYGEFYPYTPVYKTIFWDSYLRSRELGQGYCKILDIQDLMDKGGFRESLLTYSRGERTPTIELHIPRTWYDTLLDRNGNRIGAKI